MYCHQCGKEVLTGTKVCPYCGTDLNQNEKYVNSYPSEDDAPSFGFALLAFFIPIVGLVLYIFWHKEYPLKAKSCLEGIIAGVILEVLLYCCIFSTEIGMLI